MPPRPERQIDPIVIVRAQLGDRRAMETALRLAARRLRPHLRRLLDDEHDAEDALQEALSLIWRRLHQLGQPRAFWAWAFRIATREARRSIRRRHRRLAASGLEAEPAAPPVEPPDREAVAALLRQIDELSPNSRSVVGLHYIEGFTIAAVAAILEIPEGTAKSRLAYALETLRRRSGAKGADR